MRQYGVIIILLSILMFFGAGCVSEPGIDKNKFSELDRTARDLKTAITLDKPCEVPDALVEKLASGTAALKDRTVSKAESDIINAYSNLLTTYRDGLLLCKHMTQPNQFEFVPKGRIYVFQDLDPLVDKYGFPTESHVYKPTGVQWRSIARDSINVIRESAKFQTKNIENMINYK